MAFTQADIEPVALWLNQTGMSETELGQAVVGNPDALKNLLEVTAQPATLLAIISFIKQAGPCIPALGLTPEAGMTTRS